MARIVFAWEMGSNYGHISAFAPVAAELGRRGHEVVAVVQNVHEAQRFLGRHVFLLQAPHCKRAAPQPQQHTYADLIQHLGYSDPTELTTLIRTWRAVFELARPDMVLFDAAPTPMLAARGLPLAKISFGSGFALPPRLAPLPLLSHNLKVPFAEVEKREQRVVQVVNAALANLELGRIEALRDLFDTDLDLIRGLPELDHYKMRKGGEYVGPSYSLDAGTELDWPSGTGQKVFVYLRAPFRHEPLLSELGRLPVRVIAVLPELSSQAPRLPANVRASREPAQLRALVASADLAICHSAVGTGAAFLEGGVPLLLVPVNTEQAMIALRVLEGGLGLVVHPGDTSNYGTLVARLLREASFRERAAELARRHGGSPDLRVRQVVDRLERALGDDGREKAPESAATAP